MSQIQAYHCEGDLGAQPLHCHEEVEFVAVYKGRGVLQCGRSRQATSPGVLAVICPQEVHAGTPRAPEFAVKVLNVSTEWFSAAQLDWRSLWNPQAARDEAAGLPAFFQAYQAISQHHSLLSREQSLLALCHAVSKFPPSQTGFEPGRMEQAAQFLRERFAEEISLNDLAASSGLSSSYFCRMFKKSIGMTPHAYQISLRVARAKTLLARGDAPADVAKAVGFYDQSHLTLYFKRLLGITPACIAQKTIFSYTPSSRTQ